MTDFMANMNSPDSTPKWFGTCELLWLSHGMLGDSKVSIRESLCKYLAKYLCRTCKPVNIVECFFWSPVLFFDAGRHDRGVIYHKSRRELIGSDMSPLWLFLM